MTCVNCVAGMAASLAAVPGASIVTAATSNPAACFSWCHCSMRPTGARAFTFWGSTARAASQMALPLSSTASTAREYARGVESEPASISASCSRPCELRAAAMAHAVSSDLLAALMARRSTLPA
jgi:hypothetical protein